MWRWIVCGVLVVAVLGAWLTGVAAYRRGTGYFAPVFATDGASVLAVRRSTSAIIAGFGYEFFTPPATVFIRRDRYVLLSVATDGGATTFIDELPASPLEGTSLKAYHGAIFGSTAAHLRWEEGLLKYEVAVTRHDVPLSRTFVARGSWDPKTRRVVARQPWQELSATMGGDEPEQLSGGLEVIAVPGDEGLPCGLALLARGSPTVRTLIATETCAARYPGGVSASVLGPLSRRADIERTRTIKETYASLVSKGVAAGLNEGDAMLRANKDMERLGYFPRSTTISASRASCPADDSVFAISDEEFRVGLFQDIEQAISQPDEEVDKAIGEYVRHSAFETSQRLNAYLSSREHTTFFVKKQDGQCWRLRITR